MNTSMLVLDFIIFVSAGSIGFFIGVWFVDSAFQKDAEYLAAEVENLNDALDALNDSYEQAIAEGDKLYNALLKSVEAHEKLKAEIAYKASPEGIRKAAEKAMREARD